MAVERACARCGETFLCKDRRITHCSVACSNRAKRASLEERLWASTDRSGDGCWEWQRHLTEWGYGRIQLGRRFLYCHRVAYEVTYGPIPDDMLVCHRCDNPRCVRPDHLFLGTNTDNMRDCLNKGRRPRKVSPQMRDEAIAECLSGRVSQRQVARRLGISHSLVGRWVKAVRSQTVPKETCS